MGRQTAYEKALRARLRDPQLWPAIPSTAFLNRLDRLASRAYERNTVDGALAAVLVYHQLTEEMVRLLIQDIRFFVQLAVFPAEITFSDRRRQMFGQLAQELDDGLDFPGKERFLRRAARLNKIRIQVVHALPRRGNLAGLRTQARRAQRLYQQCFWTFSEAHDWFRLSFKDFSKDKFEEWQPRERWITARRS